MLFRHIAALVALIALTVPMIRPATAKSERVAAKYEYEPEVYSERAERTGCGVTFYAAWTGDPHEVLGATGSFNFFFVPEHMNVMAVIKLAGVIMGRQVPVTFAWISAKGYGKTTDFAPGQSADPGSFIAAKHSDPKLARLPIIMVRQGFTLGVTFQGRPFDELVEMPAAPDEVSRKVETCMEELQAHMEAAMKRR
jgi:hypothetical protein